jgi:hypothetical protein
VKSSKGQKEEKENQGKVHRIGTIEQNQTNVDT